MGRRRRKRKERPKDVVGERYGQLAQALLLRGLAREGFRQAGRCLIHESRQVEGGFELERKQGKPYTFFVNVGAWSKRLHAFEVEGTPYKDTFRNFPFRFRSHACEPLEALGPPERQIPKEWTLPPEGDLDELAEALAPLLLEVGLPFLRAHDSDAALLESLQAERHTRERQSPGLRRLRSVHLAVLHDALGEAEARDRLLGQARDEAAAAGTPADREVIEEAIQRFLDPVRPSLPLHELPPAEALQQLREMTGQDFGDDMEAWAAWLKENRG